MKIWNIISGAASTLFVASILTFGISTGIPSAAEAAAPACKGPNKNDPGCPGSGDGGSAADPAFAYIRPANGSPKVILANADGSNATEIFVGVKFTFAQEPAAFGDMSGGKVLIGDFSNLFLVTYSVSGGAINVDSTVMIHSRDILSTHRASPDWSPDGADFTFRTSGGFMYIDSRATYNGNGVVTDFGDPIYDEDRVGSTGRVVSIAWDAPDAVHFIADDPGGVGAELRSLDISECKPTCDSVTTTCIASTDSSTSSPSCDGAEVLGASDLRHVSVNYDANCSVSSGPHILVSGNDASGDPITFVLDRSVVSPMPTMTILNLDGNDWTDHCTIVGSPGESSEGPLHGGAIVEYDPFMGNATITLINRRGQTPDWNN